jgi:hypothetical protein
MFDINKARKRLRVALAEASGYPVFKPEHLPENVGGFDPQAGAAERARRAKRERERKAWHAAQGGDPNKAAKDAAARAAAKRAARRAKRNESLQEGDAEIRRAERLALEDPSRAPALRQRLLRSGRLTVRQDIRLSLLGKYRVDVVDERVRVHDVGASDVVRALRAAGWKGTSMRMMAAPWYMQQAEREMKLSQFDAAALRRAIRDLFTYHVDYAQFMVAKKGVGRAMVLRNRGGVVTITRPFSLREVLSFIRDNPESRAANWLGDSPDLWVVLSKHYPDLFQVSQMDPQEEALQEDDRDLRNQQRAAQSSRDPATKARYLMALRRAGRPADLTIVAASDIPKFLAYLWKTNQLDLVFNSAYPFGYPGQRNAVSGVRFLAGALRAVEGKQVQGVRFSTFFRYVRKWLDKNNQDDKFGRALGDTPLERFLRAGEPDDDRTADVDGHWVGLFERLWFPTPDQAESFGFHYGELVSIGENLNGGAVIEVNDWGVQNLDLFTTPTARDGAWANLVGEWEEAEQEALADRYHEAVSAWAGEFDIDHDVMVRILADAGINAEDHEDYTRRDVQVAVDDFIEALAKNEAGNQWEDLDRQGVVGSASESDVESMLDAWMRRGELELDPSTWGSSVRALWHEYGQDERFAEE